MAARLKERDWQAIPINIKYASGIMTFPHTSFGRKIKPLPPQQHYRTVTIGHEHLCPIHRRDHIECIDYIEEKT